jgi:hypothetical protein
LPLLMLAACLFPLDVAARRLLWEKTNGTTSKRGLRRRPRPGGKPAPNRDEAMGRLLKTKQRSGKATPRGTKYFHRQRGAQKAIDSTRLKLLLA